MRYYIATKLERAAFHNLVRDEMARCGHTITYDWTTHGPVWMHGVDRLREVGAAEQRGVELADVVIVLLPGGRGTHVELGMALALHKPTVLAANDPTIFDAVAETCVFYHVGLTVAVLDPSPSPAAIRIAAESAYGHYRHLG